MNSSVLSLQPGVVSSDLAVADRIPRNSFRPEDMLFKDRGSAEADQFRELLLCQIEQTFARPGRQSGLPSAPDEECEQMVALGCPSFKKSGREERPQIIRSSASGIRKPNPSSGWSTSSFRYPRWSTDRGG